VLSRGERESFRQAQAQIESRACYGVSAEHAHDHGGSLGSGRDEQFRHFDAGANYPGELPVRPKPTVTPKPLPILGEYADLGCSWTGVWSFAARRIRARFAPPLSSSTGCELPQRLRAAR